MKGRADYPSLDSNHEEQELCNNYFNKAVADMVKLARERGADAVVDVKSVVVLEDGRVETYKRLLQFPALLLPRFPLNAALSVPR